MYIQTTCTHVHMYIHVPTIEPGLVGEGGIFPRAPGPEDILCWGLWRNADWEAEEWNGDGVEEGEYPDAIACMCCCVREEDILLIIIREALSDHLTGSRLNSAS